MIEFYLALYGPLIAFGLLVVSSVVLYLRGSVGPALLIGMSSIVAVLFKVMADIVGPGPVEYVQGLDGQVLEAIGTFSFWQKAAFWVYPIAMLAIAVGVLWLALSNATLNKPLKSDAQKARAL